MGGTGNIQVGAQAHPITIAREFAAHQEAANSIFNTTEASSPR